MILGRIFEVLFLQKFLQKFLRPRKFLVKSENHSVHTRVILRKDWPIRGDHPGRAVQVRRAVQVLKAEGRLLVLQIARELGRYLNGTSRASGECF